MRSSLVKTLIRIASLIFLIVEITGVQLEPGRECKDGEIHFDVKTNECHLCICLYNNIRSCRIKKLILCRNREKEHGSVPPLLSAPTVSVLDDTKTLDDEVGDGDMNSTSRVTL